MIVPAALVAVLAAPLAAGDPAAPPAALTIPRQRRPAWLREEGIVMAGSWEPLLFRVRRDGSPGYEPPPERLEAYRREHSPEMVRALKSLGVNFAMIHAYKGFGLAAEGASLADAARFAELCRREGLRVGCYTSSGTIGWELLAKERPESADWVVRDAAGRPVPYGSHTFRHYMDRNRPEAAAYIREAVRRTIGEVRPDLLHFDNYIQMPGYGPQAVEEFRKFLAGRWPAEEIPRRFGVAGLAEIRPPHPASPADLLGREYLRFACDWLARSYLDLARYARSLRPDILMECNPGGPGDRIRPPVDHRLLLPGGEAFWDEGRPPGWDGKDLATRIRTYKVGRSLGNMTFAYVTNPLEAAESIAFNLDCLGCIAWFEDGRLVARPGSSEPVSPALGPWVALFRRLQPKWGGREAIADIVALRLFEAQVFGPPSSAAAAWRGEEALIEGHVPFGMAGDLRPESLDRCRAVLAAGCEVLTAGQVEGLLAFARRGRGVVLVGAAGSLDEDLHPRRPGPFEGPLGRALAAEPFRIEAAGGRWAYLPAPPEDPAALLDALRWSAGGRFTVEVDAPRWVAAEFLRGEGGTIGVHLVNYAKEPVRKIAVRSGGRTIETDLEVHRLLEIEPSGSPPR